MNTRAVCRAAIGLATLAVMGCATADQYANPVADNFGEASRQTFAAQVIDPDPQYDTAVPATSGDTVAAAIQRNRSDTVKQPPKESTTAGTSGSGGS